jgi:hypothetical protein
VRFKLARIILDAHVSVVQWSERERAEVCVPDAVIDLFKE